MNNFFHHLHPKAQFFILAFCMVALATALSWFAIFSLLERIRGESAEIEAAKISRSSFEIRRIEARREEAALYKFGTEADRVERMFAEQPLVFFEFLEGLALRNNLSIDLALDGQNSDTERPEFLRVTIGGVYRNMLRFVKSLESAPYAIEIRNISLEIINQRPVFLDSLARLDINLHIISR